MRVSICLIAIALLLGASVSARSEVNRYPSVIEFRNLSWATRFVIEVSDSGALTWHVGVDAGGSGHTCPENEGFYCVVLDGGFTFAIPNELIYKPEIGSKWKFDDTNFELIESVVLKPNPKGIRSSVIRAISPHRETTFNFSGDDGIQFMSSVLDFSEEDDSYNFASVWVNIDLLKDLSQ